MKTLPGEAAKFTERLVGWGGEARVPTPVYRREQLKLGQRVAGPAIIEEPTTTVIIPLAFAAAVDEWGNLIMERK
jgi:N-methylhydantoinase A